MLSKRLRADFALAFCALIWGATFVVIKDALADVSVIVYLAMRFSLAAAIMAIVYWRSLRKLTVATVWAGVQIGVFMFCGYAFQIFGLKLTTPSKAAFITGSSVVLVPLLLAVFASRRVNHWTWAGSLAALGGLYFLSVPREGFSGLNRGDPIVFACAVMFALHFIFIGRHVKHHSVAALSFSAGGDDRGPFDAPVASGHRGGMGAATPALDGLSRFRGSADSDWRDRDLFLAPDLGAAIRLTVTCRHSGQPRAGALPRLRRWFSRASIWADASCSAPC